MVGAAVGGDAAGGGASEPRRSPSAYPSIDPGTPWRSINGNPTFSMAELFAEIGTPI